MKVWKLSLGKDHFDNAVFNEMIKNNVVSVHPDTKAKGQSNKSQGEDFVEASKGDLFYLCRSNDTIELMGMFKDNNPMVPIDDRYANDGWVDREFILLYGAKNKIGYNKSFVNSKNKQPWWHPGDNSTFIEVKDLPLFELEILNPVFSGLRLVELLSEGRRKLAAISMSAQKLLFLQKEFHRMQNDKTYLFNKINALKDIDINKLNYAYSASDKYEKQPVVQLRKKILEKVKRRESLDESIITEMKESISQKFEKNVYHVWKEPFRILYTLFYFQYKYEVVEYLSRLVKIIQKKLDIEHFTIPNRPVHFDGPNNLGSDMIWFAIFNKTYKKQLHAYQLFFAIEEGMFKYGLYHRDKPIEKDIVENDILCLKDMINTYQKHIKIIQQDNSLEKEKITERTDILEKQKQIILQGPPGTGKTRLAKEIASYMLSGDDNISEQMKLIQFHPSYSYEDFVRGITANATTKGIEYKTENKVLAKMAEKAKKEFDIAFQENREAKPYILIIDEINRANLSSVLGELIYALEYRDEAVESMYALEKDGKGDAIKAEEQRQITLPSNLYIIGTMNTADRSIGHIDYAIRRRFTFVDVLSNEGDVLNQFPLGKKLYEETIKIFNDKDVSPEFIIDDIKIGHSYFIATKANDETAEDIEKLALKYLYQVLPLLKEYVKDGVFQKAPIIELKDKKIDLEEQINLTIDEIKEFLK